MERISVESEQDKAIQVLGETLGNCMFQKETGLCDANSCATCSTKHKIDGCYEYLDDFNQLAVDRVAAIHFSRLMVDSGKVKEMKFERAVGPGLSHFFLSLWLAIKCAGGLFIFMSLFYLLFSCSSVRGDVRETYYTPAQKAYCRKANDSQIAWVLGESKLRLRDVNGDGVINCVDRAVVFKETWDRLCSYYKDRCDFVWNKNDGNGFNHMFIVVRTTYYPWSTVYVEPQAKVDLLTKDKSKLYVDRFWGERYDPAYNRYDFARFKFMLDKCTWDGKDEYYIQKNYTGRTG